MFQKNYETVFILTPVLSEVQMKDTVDKYVGLLKELGAEIVNVENWGLKKLAYPIQKKTTGFYVMVEYKVDPTAIKKYEINSIKNQKLRRSQQNDIKKRTHQQRAKQEKIL